MDRRSFITGLAAGTAALAHTGLAQASTSEAFSKKTRPVDTMNTSAAGRTAASK